jgi:polygalacturonase
MYPLRTTPPTHDAAALRWVFLLLLLCCPATATVVAAATTGRVIRGRYIDVGPIASTKCVVTDFGAQGDGKSDDTRHIQAAFDHCGKEGGGGTIVIPAPRTFLIFSVHFTSSNQELHIEEGATLLGSDDLQAWANGTLGSALIVASGQSKSHPLEHIAITGGGTVDGQGLLFWQARGQKNPHLKNPLFRPHTVDFSHVIFGTITGPTFTQNPNHVLELGCNHCELSHINVLNPPSTGDCEKKNLCSHNTDAVDVHGAPFFIHNVNL